MNARAYVYHGEWVADCPRECGNVEFLFRSVNPGVPQSGFACSYCGALCPVEMPPDAGEIMLVLSRRPVLQTRNWYPRKHPVAVRFGLPDGQSIGDLVKESHDHGVG